ncbi:hypothetical protein Tco_1030695 [Tanacetum coccineum]|uniref:Retroviral polymerase SH3-like domain-containing protein n=1 Tax=Tanacetum coccineum TaxID=301880 RepID=A0ABQ5G743_9ASTR
MTAILTKVKKIKSVDKGKRYKRRKSSKEFAGTGLDFEEVKSAFEKVNTGGIKVSSGIEEINAGSLDVNTGIDPVTTDSIRVSVPSPDREDWDTIRAKLEANAELKESILGKDLTVEDYAKRMVELLTKKTGKRRKQIARKGFHTDHERDESEDSDEANKKNDSTSGGRCILDCVRENGTDMVYISFGAMLTDISRDDLTDLYRIVMKKHGMNELEDEFEKVLWEYLKNMFEEPLSTDSIWSLPGQQRIICWRYYDACRVHCLNLESADVYMLIERKYPLSAEVCKAMLDKKLQEGKPDEDCYSQNSKAYIILNKHTRKVEESLNVTFDETPPNTSPLVDDDLDEEEAIKVTEKKILENDIKDENLEIDEIVNIKESRNHPLENVIGNLNQRTLRSQAQNQSNFLCFISTIEPKNVNESLGDES